MVHELCSCEHRLEASLAISELSNFTDVLDYFISNVLVVKAAIALLSPNNSHRMRKSRRKPRNACGTLHV